MQTYQGSCHCGAVTFEATADITSGVRCNCSHCHIKGFVLSFLPNSSVTIKTGEDNLTTYTFNTHKISHRFCKTCGVQCFGMGKDPAGSDTFAINLRCLKDFDLDSIDMHDYDGKSV